MGNKNKKKKILFVLHVPPPVHGSSIVGEFIKKSSVINNTFNSRYINLGTSKSIDEIGKNGIKKWLIYFRILITVFKQLAVFKPDVVYLAMTAKGVGFYKDMLVVCITKFFKAQLVIHFHNKGVSDNETKTLDNLFYKMVFKNTKVILLSKYLLPDIKKYINEENVYYCPNGIPSVTSQAIEKSKKSDIVQILFLSNLIKSKGVMILLNALSILKGKGVNFRCNFVGGIGDISESIFLDTVSKLELEANVKYLGKKFGNEKNTVFNNSDIFVLPTFSDCFPLVLLEASQYRLSIISTFEGAIPEIIEDGYNGFLVPEKDAITLAEKLELLIKDKNLRVALGNAAYSKYTKEYTLSKFEKTMCSILKSINPI